MNRAEIFQLIEAERRRQDIQHPGRPWRGCDSDCERLAILGEEVGEVAATAFDLCGVDEPKLVNAFRHGLREELVQVAAVAVRWIEVLG